MRLVYLFKYATCTYQWLKFQRTCNVLCILLLARLYMVIHQNVFKLSLLYLLKYLFSEKVV